MSLAYPGCQMNEDIDGRQGGEIKQIQGEWIKKQEDFSFPLNEFYRGLRGVITSKKWKETYTSQVMPEIGFLPEWKGNILLISEGWGVWSLKLLQQSSFLSLQPSCKDKAFQRLGFQMVGHIFFVIASLVICQIHLCIFLRKQISQNCLFCHLFLLNL